MEGGEILWRTLDFLPSASPGCGFLSHTQSISSMCFQFLFQVCFLFPVPSCSQSHSEKFKSFPFLRKWGSFAAALPSFLLFPFLAECFETLHTHSLFTTSHSFTLTLSAIWLIPIFDKIVFLSATLTFILQPPAAFDSTIS